MKFDEKSQKISEKSQRRIDRIGIILGLSLLIACGLSYFVLDAFAQQDFQLDCPKTAYYGLDKQGNDVCRDIQTNQILESVTSTNLDSEKTKSDSGIITIPEIDKIIFNVEQIPIVEITILVLIGIASGIIGISIKKGKFGLFQIRGWSGIQKGKFGLFQIRGWSGIQKGKFGLFQIRGWSGIQKEQVRNNQYGKCNMCFTPPSKWKYDYTDGNKNNNDLNNCQGLCSDCYSVKTKRDNRISIYQKSN